MPRLASTYGDGFPSDEGSQSTNGDQASEEDHRRALAAGMLLVPAATASAVPVHTAKKRAAVTVSSPVHNVLFVDVNPDKGRGFWNIKVQRLNGKGKWVTKKNYRTQGANKTRTTTTLPNGTYRVVVKPKRDLMSTGFTARVHQQLVGGVVHAGAKFRCPWAPVRAVSLLAGSRT